MKKYTLAANYSKELFELIREDIDIVDAVKVSEFSSLDYLNDYSELRKIKPVFIHGLVQTINPGELNFGKNFNLEILQNTLALTDTKYISFHLQCIINYGQQIDKDSFLVNFINDLSYIRDAIRLPIHLENIHFYFPCEGKDNNAAFVCQPSFIEETLVRSNSKFLLDIAHAQIAAWHLNIHPIEYINSLPLHLVEEVHVTGPIMVENELRDKHHEIAEEGYSLLEHVLKESNVKTVTLEYGGIGKIFENRSDKETLKRQLLRLRKILK
ncbi:DUF692 family multinuclear iron-containing protein [Tissierella sp.]|uniref:multinuclear nonheme iron-dependent oxidase n=1 Tax=Tissierella sp. TaxID=41274 RepID=UPI002865178B|nr:DUF692 family multinuclear iron-containing protein [Tissierella sp.]MDR7857852.1 DUF692 family protein [Tissierella sp.]